MSSQRPEQSQPPGSPGAVLAVARAHKQASIAAEAGLMVAAVEWAAMHEPVAGDEAAWFVQGEFLPIAGEGAPHVGEFAVAEFAAAIGLTTDAGKVLVGRAVEIAHRLPRLWKLLLAGRVAAWQARRVADHTISLNRAAATFVDDQVSAVAGKIGPVQLERLIAEAQCRHMPEIAQWPDDPRSMPDQRGVWIDSDQVSMDGVVEMRGSLDLGDALDLDKALAVTASQLKLAGSAESLDARRATALGELARNQLAFTYDTAVEEVTQQPSRNNGSRKTDGRPVTLYLHLSDQALTGASGVGRCENTRTPITPDRIQEWCGREGVQLTVKPVIDLDDHVHVAAYEVPDRLKEATGLRDLQCVFPWCTRPARGCDRDHVIPHDQGGSTCSCNIAPLCRHHHRLKTLTAWRYKMPEPAVYVGPHPMATSSSATIRAPSMSPHPDCEPSPPAVQTNLAKVAAGPTRPTSSHPAPRPRHGIMRRGHRHAQACPLRSERLERHDACVSGSAAERARARTMPATGMTLRVNTPDVAALLPRCPQAQRCGRAVALQPALATPWQARQDATMAAPAPPRPVRSREQLVDALGHVGYEAWMAAVSAEQLRAPTPTPLSGERANALIESGLVHARNLTEFFTPPKGTKRTDDDMIPADFADAWPPGPADAVQYLRTHRKVLHVDVAHLSWGRVTKPLQAPDTVKVMRSAVLVALAWRDYLWTSAPDLAQSQPFALYMVSAKTTLDSIPDIPPDAFLTTTTTTSGPPQFGMMRMDYRSAPPTS